MSTPIKVNEYDDMAAPYEVEPEYTVEDDDTLVPEAERFQGDVALVMRRDTKQSWSQAKPFTVLKDMTPERTQRWIDGMNEVADFAKFRVA